MSKSVFISHSSKDKAVADEICERLERVGIGCWIAPRDVPAGHPYGEAILNGIEACAVFLLIWSENSNNSLPVANEIERAYSYQKLIVPLRIREVFASKRIEFFIANAQWVDAYSSPIEDRIEYLASVVRAAESNTPPPPGPGRFQPTQKGLVERLFASFRGHRFLAALGIVGLALALAVPSIAPHVAGEKPQKAIESQEITAPHPSPPPPLESQSASQKPSPVGGKEATVREPRTPTLARKEPSEPMKKANSVEDGRQQYDRCYAAAQRDRIPQSQTQDYIEACLKGLPYELH